MLRSNIDADGHLEVVIYGLARARLRALGGASASAGLHGFAARAVSVDRGLCLVPPLAVLWRVAEAPRGLQPPPHERKAIPSNPISANY